MPWEKDVVRTEISEVLRNYPSAQQQPLTDNSLADVISHELADAVRDFVDSDAYRVTGSRQQQR
jgi:hypothetical protein